MKVIKTANTQKLKMSKKEWLSIGERTGWMRHAQENMQRDMTQALQAIDAPQLFKTTLFKEIRKQPKVGDAIVGFFDNLKNPTTSLQTLFNVLNQSEQITLDEAYQNRLLPQTVIFAFKNSTGNPQYRNTIWKILKVINSLEDTRSFNIQQIKDIITQIQQISKQTNDQDITEKTIEQTTKIENVPSV
jgi:hypothetical protein